MELQISNDLSDRAGFLFCFFLATASTTCADGSSGRLRLLRSSSVRGTGGGGGGLIGGGGGGTGCLIGGGGGAGTFVFEGGGGGVLVLSSGGTAFDAAFASRAASKRCCGGGRPGGLGALLSSF